MTTEPGMTIMRESVCAFHLHVSRSTVAILETSENGTRLYISSGTCIKVKDKYFIATASHCVKRTPLSCINLVHSTEPSNQIIDIISSGYHDSLDIAYLELSETAAEELNKDFIPTTRLQYYTSDIPNDLAFLSGFPAITVTVDHDRREIGAGLLCALTETLTPQELPEDHDNNVDIFISYPNSDNWVSSSGQTTAPELPGVSGGGFWAAYINDGIWTPEKSRLIGIDISWHRGREWARGVQIQHWANLIIERFPSLSDGFPLLARNPSRPENLSQVES